VRRLWPDLAVAQAHNAGILEPTGRGLLSELLSPVPAAVTLFSRLVVWLFAWLMFLRLAAYLDQPSSATVWT
jgi:hypothetical protein